MFHQLLDDEGLPYFTYTPSAGVPSVNLSETPHDLANFLSSEMSVAPRVTGLFSSDLTSRDDELIAVLSLLLLLTIEAIATTILLRTSKGDVSNAGFSVKHFIDMVRDFHIRHLLRGKGSVAHKTKVNFRLLAIAITFLAVTFFVEVLVLVLTEPGEQPVRTSIASVGVVQPITPQWADVRDHTEQFVSRPCSVLSLNDVLQGKTLISTCLSSNLTESSVGGFERISNNVSVQIVSDLHRFGVEHLVRYGDRSAAFSGRAYLNPEHLTPGKRKPVPRLLGERPVNANETTDYNPESVYLIHNLYIAYLFSSYVRAAAENSVNVSTLREIKPHHELLDGPEYDIIKKNGEEDFVKAKAQRFITTFTGPSVGAIEALRHAQVVFRASIGLGVVGPDEYDLDMGSGIIEKVPVILWMETKRTMNCLILLAILMLSLLFLMGIRLVLKPASTAEIAGYYVKSAVGADLSRSPLQLARTEEKSFYFESETDDNEYRYGAEVEHHMDVVQSEYEREPE